MDIKEKIQTIDSSNRQLIVEQSDESFINFHTSYKKENYEVSFYVFSEDRINQLVDQQRSIYETLEKEDSKNNLYQLLDKVLKNIKNKKNCHQHTSMGTGG